MWRPGDTKSVSNDRAHELLTAGHVIEAKEQTGDDELGPEHPLQAVADALGATLADAPALPEVPGIPAAAPRDMTLENLKEDKPKRKTKEEKDAEARETKEAQ